MSVSTLCQACGLCCDGTLFARVPVTPEEAVRLKACALVIEPREDGSPALRQPCAALKGRGCSRYAERPAGCRRYECNLYAALAADEVALAEALGIVEETHRLIAALGMAAGVESTSGGVVAALRGSADTLSTPEVQKAREAVSWQLARHFLGRSGK